jgi:hypothetical protein
MRWNEHELETRDSIIKYFTRYLGLRLTKINPAFRFVRIETPILLSLDIARKTQRSIEIRLDDQTLQLRTSTQSGALEAGHDFLNGKDGIKQKLPVVIWQHGKVFNRLNGRIHETYSLEYQVLFSASTAASYREHLRTASESMLKKTCGEIYLDDYDSYDPSDVYCAEGTGDPLLTIRDHDATWAGKCLELVVHLDNCVRASIRQEAS